MAQSNLLGNGLLEKLDRNYRKNKGVSPAKRVKQTALGKLRKLEQYKENGTVLDMFADYSDGETGDLYHVDDFRIMYVLKCEDIKKLFPTYVPFGNSYLLGTTFKVTIKEIDDEGTVFLNAVSCSVSKDGYQEMVKKGSSATSHASRLEMLLFDSLNAPSGSPKALVRGTVTMVEKDRIFLDIFDTGLIGVVPVKNYAEQFRRDLRDVVEVGDSLKGVVFAYRSRADEDTKHFLISTANFIPDAWAIARKFKVNDIIVIKCVDIPQKCPTTQLYFWGVSRMLPSIDIMSDYSNKVPQSAVSIGKYYKCKIKDIDIKNHHLKVVPYAECNGYTADTTAL